jgi:hypothetical protein
VSIFRPDTLQYWDLPRCESRCKIFAELYIPTPFRCSLTRGFYLLFSKNRNLDVVVKRSHFFQMVHSYGRGCVKDLIFYLLEDPIPVSTEHELFLVLKHHILATKINAFVVYSPRRHKRKSIFKLVVQYIFVGNYVTLLQYLYKVNTKRQ